MISYITLLLDTIYILLNYSTIFSTTNWKFRVDNEKSVSSLRL